MNSIAILYESRKCLIVVSVNLSLFDVDIFNLIGK